MALFLVIFLIPSSANAAGLVPCGNPDQQACTINDFFTMLSNIYDFIVLKIATPLAIAMVTIGGILLLVSAGNPSLSSLGRKTLWAAVIGLVLAYGSWVILKFILNTIGYKQI